MSDPDVRWDGVSHKQIVDWVNGGRGPRVTTGLEGTLQQISDALIQTADLVNATLQRVNAGEWTGNAASVAAKAMQVARDFDDTMGNHSRVGNLSAAGQSDIAGWAKSSVPSVPEVETPTPTGGFIDMIKATEDYNDQRKAAKNAEERARQVMRDYQTMTSDRIGGMPRLSLPPQIVISDEPDTITVPPGGPGPGGGKRSDYVPPRGGDSTDSAPPPGGAPSSAPPGGAPGPVPPGGAESTSPGATESSSFTEGRPSLGMPVGLADGGRSAGAGPGGGAPGFIAGPGGGPGAGGGAVPRGGGASEMPPRQSGGVRGAEPGVRGVAGRAGLVEAGGRGGGPGMAPMGAGRGNSEEDKDHDRKYGVDGAEIFEPDHDDGLLHDPYRPGSFVAPATIGDDEDE